MLLFSQFCLDVAGYQTRPFFLGSQEMSQISVQSYNSIDNYRVHRHRTDRQTETFVKTVISDLGGLKM